MAMSTLGIHHPELYRRTREQKEKEWEVEEDENRTVNTTNSSVTIQRSNVSEFGMANNARASVDEFLREFGTATVSITLRADGLVLIVRNTALQRGVDVAILSDEAIIQQAREFVQEQEPQQQQQPLQNIIARDDESATSSLGSLGGADSAPTAVANPDNVDGLTNESIGTFSHSTSTGSTARGAIQAAQALRLSNAHGMSDAVQNWDPIHIPDANASAVSPPRQTIQQQQQDQRPVQDTAAIENNNSENCDSRQFSVAPSAAAARPGDDVVDTSTDNGNGQEEENKDKKPSAKKPRLN